MELLGSLLFEVHFRQSGPYCSLRTAHVIPRRYLQNGNILAARSFLSQFISQIISSRPKLLSPLQTSPLSVPPTSEVTHTTEPLINFCQLAVLTCQRANREKNQVIRESWVRLCGTYQSKGGALTTKEVRAVSQIITICFTKVENLRDETTV